MDEKLQRVTFLRLFPQQSFQYVDQVINEINQSNYAPLRSPCNENKHSAAQTDEIVEANCDHEVNEEETTTGVPLYTTHQKISSLMIRFTSSFQYNSEAEFASLSGRIGTRFVKNEEELAPQNQGFRLSSKMIADSSRLDESLETQQMRRLDEFVEWRRSLLQKNYM
jgi:hypothetical protein